jgi:DNA-binding MarR family transcriptional regulator
MTKAQEQAKSPDVDIGRLAGYLGYQIRQAQTASFRDLAAPLKALGLTPGEFSLLTIVRANPGLRQADLVQVYGLDKSTLSVAVARLAKRGLIRQRRDEEDRRRQAFDLTAEGGRILDRATEIVEDQERRMADALAPGEAERLMGALRRIVAALDGR